MTDEKIDTLTDAELERELLKLSRSKMAPTKLQAKVAAIRTVLRIRQREREAIERAHKLEQQAQDDKNVILEWPSKTPDKLADINYWPGPDDPFAELDLARGDTQGDRDRWRTDVEGPPPWIKRA